MGKIFLNWLGNFLKDSVSLCIVFVISVAVCAGLLYAFNVFWALYISTPTGQQFAKLFNSDAAAIERVFNYRPLFFSIHVNIVAVIICLSAGIIGRLFLLVRYLYEYRGFWGRLFFWVAPCACVSAYIILTYIDLDWKTAILLSAVSTLVLLNRCIRLISRLLPEITYFK